MEVNLVIYKNDEIFEEVKMRYYYNDVYIYKWNVSESGSYEFEIKIADDIDESYNVTFQHTAPFNKSFDAYISKNEGRKSIGGIEKDNQILISFSKRDERVFLEKKRFKKLTINPEDYGIPQDFDVYMPAEFNGWNPKFDKFEKISKDSYYIELALEDGDYEYKLYCNKKWYPDDNNLKLIVGEIGDIFPKGKIGNGNIVYDAKDLNDERKAIKHNIYSLDYLNKIDDNEIEFSIRTQMNDVEEVNMHIQEESGIEEIYEMYRITNSAEKFDYFKLIQLLEINPIKFRYYFELKDRDTIKYFGKNGLVDSEVEFYEIDFNLSQFYIFHVPKWAKESIWYNIFPERFYNGNLNNDPIYNEFGPSIYKKPKNRPDLIKHYKWDRENNELGEFTNNSWTSDFEEKEEWEKLLNLKLNRDLKYARMYGGDLIGIKKKIPYLKELGITAIWLNPVFFADTNHKYGANDFRHISPDFGVMQTTGNDYGVEVDKNNRFGNKIYKDVLDDDFNRKELDLLKVNLSGEDKGKNGYGETENPETWIWTESDLIAVDLIKELHKNGIRVIFDGVFNHCGVGHWSFEMALMEGENSKYSKWHKFNDFSKHKKIDENMSEEEVYNVLLHNKKHVKYNGWAGFNELPEFDSHDLEYKQYIFNITKKWLIGPDGKISENWKESDGIDGFRLDVPNCLENQKFWNECRKVVKDTNCEAYITAELWDDARKDINSGKKYDTVMNYEWLKTVIRFFINQGEKQGKDYKLSPTEFFKELEEKRYWYPFQALQVSQNLNGSHDTDRLISRVVNDRLGSDLENGKQIDKDYNTIRPDLAKDSHKNTTINWKKIKIKPKDILKLISIFQMTYIGAPMIYYGDEVGMWGATDPYCRKPMLWEEFEYDNETNGTISGKNKKYKVKPDLELFDWYRKIISIRKNNPVLVYGKFIEILGDDENNIVVYERKNENESIIIILNNSFEEIKDYTVSTDYESIACIDLITNKKYRIDELGSIMVDIKAKFGYILKLQL